MSNTIFITKINHIRKAIYLVNKMIKWNIFCFLLFHQIGKQERCYREHKHCKMFQFLSLLRQQYPLKNSSLSSYIDIRLSDQEENNNMHCISSGHLQEKVKTWIKLGKPAAEFGIVKSIGQQHSFGSSN